MTESEIGTYKITKKRIGRGAFSIIYKGYHKYTQRDVAIKEINYDTNKKMTENIKNEFEIMKKLKHENIIALHDIYYDKLNKNIYLVLDYYEKGDLSKFLDNAPLKEKYAKKYMKQLSSGLEYLINNDVMHRDLKPQNILVSNDNILKITDFGFARYAGNNALLQTLCGSPMYMAPEIMKYKKYNNKSDLWSVGIIMYEMLFGHVPYKAKNFIQLIKCINKIPIKIPDNFVISTECHDLLFSLLKKDPKERIDWNDLFNSPWFIHDDSNKYLEFSINDNASLPNLNKMNNSNQFHSFKHRSIRDISQELDIDIFGNKNIIMSVESSTENIESDDSFESADSSSELEDEDVPNTYNRSEPINISDRRNNTVYVTREMVDDDFVKVSDPRHNKSLSKSIKEYLYSSFNFLKQSYDYIKTI